MIPVTKPYLPNREKLKAYIDGIYERQWLTNNGKLVQELTIRLEEYLGVENLLLVSNGTLALQIAYRALGVSDSSPQAQPEAVTTPFSFIATSSSLKWDGVQPVFVDIDPDTWCLNPEEIEAAITPKTRAIVPVHVFGNACEVEPIEEIAKRRGLKVIYDASHAFGVAYNDESLLKRGDAATLSFHATKLFHTVEGGAIVFRRKEDLERARKMINFGISGPDVIDELGINAKMNELQAAMGLCVLDEIEANINARLKIWNNYLNALDGRLQLQKRNPNASNNFSYFPVVFRSESQALTVASVLKESGVIARRYFYPSLDSIGIGVKEKACRHSREISKKILCLPIYSGLDLKSTEFVAHKIKEAV